MKKFNTNTMAYFLLAVFMVFGMAGAVNAEQMAVVATAAADFSSGAHSVISVEPVDGSRTVQNELAPTGSDITVVAYGDYFYRMERSGAHNITKYHVDEPTTPVWQYSTEGEESNSNPHDMIFVSSEKAYVLRYGSTKAWIVNPSATTEAEFKIGELDLSAYADADGKPEMHSGTIVDNRLFITLQRVDFSGGWGNYEYKTPYVAVFDVATDTEIDIADCGCAMKGIEVPSITNLGVIQYLETNDMIYLQGMGDYDASTDAGISGIISIDADTYGTNTILTGEAGTYGAVSGMVIVSEAKGYFIGYAGWGDNTLYSFDPACGCSIEAVPGLENKSIAGMETGVYTDKNGMVWICNQTDARVDILNPADDTIAESVSTSLNPLKVAFTESESTNNGDADDDGGSSSSGCFIGGLK